MVQFHELLSDVARDLEALGDDLEVEQAEETLPSLKWSSRLASARGVWHGEYAI